MHTHAHPYKLWFSCKSVPIHSSQNFKVLLLLWSNVPLLSWLDPTMERVVSHIVAAVKLCKADSSLWSVHSLQESYKACSMQVLDQMRSELLQLHVTSSTTDAATIKQKMDLYGGLLNFTTDSAPQAIVLELVCWFVQTIWTTSLLQYSYFSIVASSELKLKLKLYVYVLSLIHLAVTGQGSPKFSTSESYGNLQ